MKFRVRCALAGGLAAVLGLTLAPAVGAPTASASTASVVSTAAASWKPPQGAFFNKPRSKAGTQFKLETQVLNAIRRSPKGSTIRIATFSFDRGPIADALINARKRGVRVQMIVNGHEGAGAQTKLRRKVGSNPKNNSFLFKCKNGSCRGNGDAQHSKFYLFSKTGGARNTVMLGSINMKLNGHKNQYNDLWVANNSEALHNYLVSIFNQMRNDTPLRSPYRRKTFWHGNYDLHVLPRGGAPDPIMRALAPVKCTGAKGTYQGRTAIRVNMHAWDGDRGATIAKRLRNLYGAGCNVKIQYGMAGKKVRQVLAVKTKRGLVPTRSNGFDTNGDGLLDLYTHQKVMTINGRYASKRSVRLVFNGSSNFQDSGANGDEIVFRVKNAGNHTRYANNWNWMWKYKTRSVPWVRTTTALRSSGADSGADSGQPEAILSDPLSDATLAQVENQG